MSNPSFAAIQEEIANMLAIPEAELTDENRAAMEAYLDELATQESGKVDAFGQFVRIQAAIAEACDVEAKRLQAKSRAMKSRLDYIRNRYANIMQQHGIKKIAGNAYTLSLRKVESVDVTDMAALEKEASQYVVTKIETRPDKAAIKAAIKAGESVPGCELKERETLQVR